MRRHPSLVPLSRFHRSILFVSLMAKKKAPPMKGYPTALNDKIQYARTFYRDQLKAHFEHEQNVLFPQIAGKDQELDLLISEMKEERNHLDMLFSTLKPDTTTETSLDQLGLFLEKHIRKEERIFFQKIQEVLTPDELDRLKLQ